MSASSSSAVTLVFLLVAGTADARQLPAQNPPLPQSSADTGTAEAGRQDGIVAAEQRRMESRATVGYVGGLAIGTLGAILFREEPLGVVGVVPGLAIIGAAWRLGDTRPPTGSISERGVTYVRAFTESYERRLRDRWRNAAIVGGVAGTVSGLAMLAVLFKVISTGYD